MNKFLASLFIYVMAVSLSILIMMYGWGLKPESWWWIIGGGVFIRLLTEAMSAIVKMDK